MHNVAELPTRAVLINTDGTIEQLQLDVQAFNASLEPIYRILGADNVNAVYLTDRYHMWLASNSSGNLPVNHVVTWLAAYFGLVRQVYFGTVLIAGVRGDLTIGLTDDQTAALVKRITDAARTHRG